MAGAGVVEAVVASGWRAVARGVSRVAGALDTVLAMRRVDVRNGRLDNMVGV